MAREMGFDEFLEYIREHVGDYCDDGYWRDVYSCLSSRIVQYVKLEVPFLANSAMLEHYRRKLEKLEKEELLKGDEDGQS